MTKESSFLTLNPPLLSVDEWDAVWQISTIRQLKKGDAFIDYGKIADVSAFVLSGVFKQSWLGDNGNERNMDFYFAGDFICDDESYNKNISSAHSFKALEDSQLMVFQHAALHSLLEKDARISRWALRLSQELAQRKLEHLQVLSIADPFERYKTLFNNRPDIIAGVSNTEVAKYLFLARETISRARLKLLDEARNFCD